MISHLFKAIFALLFITTSASAQVITRSELAPYILRKDAMEDTRTVGDNYVPFAPMAVGSALGEITREQVVTMPQSWVDAQILLHLESVASAYTLSVNGHQVALCEDQSTPTTYNITRYMRVGENTLSVTSHASSLAFLEEGVAAPNRNIFEGSYLSIISKLDIIDYRATIAEVEESEHGQLLLDVVVRNDFNYPETIEVGFDVYDPTGKLLDFSTTTATLAGGEIDTIRFAPYLYGAKKYMWNPDAAVGMQVIGRPTSRFSDQQLYSVMIFTKRNRVSSGYIPFKVGYTTRQYLDGAIEIDGRKVELRATPYNALGSEQECEEELRKIKAQGFNTLSPDYPQPLWFYALCDRVGLYVIDKAAINAPTNSLDRTVGGTPSNDPALLGEYLERVKKMYYRTRNFTCVVAYSLGGEAGNGYNMYKAYQWLKGIETQRPIIYPAAAGEWNDDPLEIN